MIVQKLFSSDRKALQPKEPYSKPVYKSYKELLHLDRPRKKMISESSSSEEDFLQRLLNEERERSTQSKKKKRMISSKKKPPTQQRQRRQSPIAREQGKPSLNVVAQIKLIRDAQIRKLSLQKKNSNDLSLIQEERIQPIKQVPKQAISLKLIEDSSSKSLVKSRTSIMIDNKSFQPLPILYNSSHHIFYSTSQKKLSVHALLKDEKQRYFGQFQPNEEPAQLFKQNHIQHIVQKAFQRKFTYKPNIEPLNPNWRFNLIVKPPPTIPQRQFIDRKTLFRTNQQEQRFIQSLRDLSKKKRH